MIRGASDGAIPTLASVRLDSGIHPGALPLPTDLHGAVVSVLDGPFRPRPGHVGLLARLPIPLELLIPQVDARVPVLRLGQGAEAEGRGEVLESVALVDVRARPEIVPEPVVFGGRVDPLADPLAGITTGDRTDRRADRGGDGPGDGRGHDPARGPGDSGPDAGLDRMRARGVGDRV